MRRRHVILVVDDMPEGRETLAAYLKGLGYFVVQAEDGAQALVVARFIRVDLILMDLRLPNMSGQEAAEQLGEDARTSATPIIAITGQAVPEDLHGFADVLLKPWPIAAIEGVIKRVIRQGRRAPSTGS